MVRWRTTDAVGGWSYIVRLSWREWSIGLGVVFGTLSFQSYLHLGPLHAFLFIPREKHDATP